MKSFIKHKLRESLLIENPDTVCDQMCVDTYEKGIELIISAIGIPESNPEKWKEIAKPLSMWKSSVEQIRKELPTGMTGDSEIDESNTYFAMIQSLICK